jgi:flagella basal body P-ring formation protein FlgA
MGLALHASAQTPSEAQSIADAALRTPFHGVDSKFNRNPAPRIASAAVRSSDHSKTTQPEFGQPRGAHSQTIDSETLWQFSVVENASTSSPIIRLRDVVRPLESKMAAWRRLADATVGLMPLDGSPAKISRDRLADLIVGGQATAGRIKIYGEETIVVHAVQNHDVSPAHHSSFEPTQPASATPQSLDATYVAHAMLDVPATPEFARDSKSFSQDELDFETRERLSHWVELGLNNQFRDLADAFDHQATFIAHELGQLPEMQGIREIRFLDPMPTWSPENPAPITCRLKIDARSRADNCEGIVRVTFTPKPAVVVAQRPLQRGHRVGPGDVHLQPSPVADLSGDWVMEVDDVIGMEVVGLIRSGVPLRPSDFAAPRLVRRGDLVEVQVSGGGIRVTTTAKALGDGAQNELIEVETISPKRRLLAKVVEPSVVEIVTQPQRVLANKPTRKWQPQP